MPSAVGLGRGERFKAWGILKNGWYKAWGLGPHFYR